MTLFDLWGLARRVWWITLGGLVLTLAATYQSTHQPGVYWAQVDVVILRPSVPTAPNVLSNTATRVIEAASVLQRDVNGFDGAHVVSDGITIVDKGIRSGVEVRLPNVGGQWANNFNRPFLDVQVVDTSHAGASKRLDDVLARIGQSLTARQVAAGVEPINRLSIQLSPAQPEIRYLTGLPTRAGVVTLLLGVGLTGGAVVVVGRRVRGRPRQPRLPDGPDPGEGSVVEQGDRGSRVPV